MIGLEPGSYEAYCFDEALWHLGTSIDSDLDRAGQKPSKNEGKTNMARQKVFDKYFPPDQPTEKKFADPALFFS